MYFNFICICNGKRKKEGGYKIYFKGNRKRICILTKQIITSLASSASTFLTLMDLVKPWYVYIPTINGYINKQNNLLQMPKLIICRWFVPGQMEVMVIDSPCSKWYAIQDIISTCCFFFNVGNRANLYIPQLISELSITTMWNLTWIQIWQRFYVWFSAW